MTVCGATTLPSDLVHLAPVLVQHEAVGEHGVIGRTAAGAAAFQQGGMEPAAMLVRAFQIHHPVRPVRRPVGLEVGPHFQRESVGGATVEPDVEDVVHLHPVPGRMLPEEAGAGALLVPGVGALGLEGLGDAGVHRLVAQDSTEPSFSGRTKTVIGTPQARWRETTQSGRLAIMPVMRFSLTALGHPSRRS